MQNYYFIFGFKLEASSLKQSVSISQSLCQGSVLYLNEVQLIFFMFLFLPQTSFFHYLLPLAQPSLLNQSYKATSLNPSPSFFAENHSISCHLSPSPPCPGISFIPLVPVLKTPSFNPVLTFQAASI